MDVNTAAAAAAALLPLEDLLQEAGRLELSSVSPPAALSHRGRESS